MWSSTMKRILLASAACLALSLPAMAATTVAQPKPSPQNQQQSLANQPAQSTNTQSSQPNQPAQNTQSSQANQPAQSTNAQQAQVIRPSRLSKEQVREIQMKLNKDGFSSGHVDGIWGRDTDQAILNFQKAKKLSGHGELNQQTLADLGVRLNNQSETTGSTSDRNANRQMRGTAAAKGQATSGSAMNGPALNSNAKGQTATTSNHMGSMNNKAGTNPSNTKP
jgi:hypothetical protein